MDGILKAANPAKTATLPALAAFGPFSVESSGFGGVCLFPVARSDLPLFLPAGEAMHTAPVEQLARESRANRFAVSAV